MLEQQIQQHFIDSADLKYQSAQSLSLPISAAVQALLACITGGGKSWPAALAPLPAKHRCLPACV